MALSTRFGVGSKDYGYDEICPLGSRTQVEKLSNFDLGTLRGRLWDAKLYWGEELQRIQTVICWCRRERAAMRQTVQQRHRDVSVDAVLDHSPMHQDVLGAERLAREYATLANDELSLLRHMIRRIDVEMESRIVARGYVPLAGRLHLIDLNRARRAPVRHRSRFRLARSLP